MYGLFTWNEGASDIYLPGAAPAALRAVPGEYVVIQFILGLNVFFFVLGYGNL